MLIHIKGSHISVSNVYVRLCYSHFYYVPLSLRIQHATCRERDSTTGYENGLLGNKQEIGRTVCVTTGGTRGDLRAKRDTIVLTSRSYRLDASYSWFYT